MNKISTLILALLLTTTASAQRYSTKSMSEYQQLYSKKYSLIRTFPYPEAVFEFSKTRAYMNFDECEEYEVKKVITVGTEKKYTVQRLHCSDEDEYTVTVGKEFISFYADNGQKMLKFRIVKVKSETEDLNW